MSYAGIVMDVVLMALLIAALMFGVRLDKRLKGLRAAHDSFARAVADLDQAAIKAHSALRELHSGTDESQELLHGRILVARDLLAKLESQIARAEKAERDIGHHVESAKALKSDAQSARLSSVPLVAIKPEPEPPPAQVPDQSVTKPADNRRFGALRAERPSPFKEGPFKEEPKTSAKPKLTRPSDDEGVPHISENVLASLNDMLRSFEVPKPDAKNRDDDLFDTPSEPPLDLPARRRRRFDQRFE
ncbi:DUF6468 domain-containing protein [Asticcacaulis endophyticus]|uniref:DUF6468 domain-containing protein n=1 Tax=Asticcacaulis endophyticus TaxID=1395890 RepID=A0A918UTC9_9CAUL|nr:DUF6468 domain-containing protein [Asticcacaulis endophyticus]GGZ33638.1 hypothetical protein GCM10011273_19990 [Asticcacaulis endophyticus]